MLDNTNKYPIEDIFSSSSVIATWDKTIKNRIHFKFPQHWVNNIFKNSVIGIRNIYMSKSHRHVNIDIAIKYCKNTELTPDVANIIETKHVVVDVFLDDEAQIRNIVRAIINGVSSLPEMKYFRNVLTAYYEYIVDENTNEHYCRFIIKSPFNELSEKDRTDNNKNFYFIKFTVEMNDDAKAVLNYDTDTRKGEGEAIITKNIWDRNSVYCTSSIASLSYNNYLGHTRRYTIEPIKYYSINNFDKTFWVDLWSTLDHKCPVILPDDHKDELNIEAQLIV